MTCENCKYRVTYQELDDNNYDLDDKGRVFHVCMLTDADVELAEHCNDFERRPREMWETMEEWMALK